MKRRGWAVGLQQPSRLPAPSSAAGSDCRSDGHDLIIMDVEAQGSGFI